MSVLPKLAICVHSSADIFGGQNLQFSTAPSFVQNMGAPFFEKDGII